MSHSNGNNLVLEFAISLCLDGFLVRGEGKLVLIAPGGDLVFEEEDGDALDVALSGKPFQLADLPCADPPAMLRLLWTGGLIERLTA